MSNLAVEGMTVEMTREEFETWEREIQLGLRTTLPNGQTISEFQADLVKNQIEQEKTRSDSATLKKGETLEDLEVDKSSIEKSDYRYEVTIHANGAVSASPIEPETEAKADAGSGENTEAESDLPENFPGRDALISAGFGNVERVAKLTFEDLVGIKNIGEKTAQQILDYGK